MEQLAVIIKCFVSRPSANLLCEHVQFIRAPLVGDDNDRLPYIPVSSHTHIVYVLCVELDMEQRIRQGC